MWRKRPPKIDAFASWLMGLMLAASAASAQPSKSPSFDVASVKVSNQSVFSVNPQRSGGLIRWTTDLRYLIGYAYRIDLTRLAGTVPGSLYELEARTKPDATDDEVRLMFQMLLADRFKMAAHHATKEADGYALVVNKGGLKIREAKQGEPAPPLPPWMDKGSEAALEGRVVSLVPSTGVIALTGRGVTMAQLAARLERDLGQYVTDQTGLLGKYYFGFRYSPGDQPGDSDTPSLFAALQDLGLKLEKRRGPVAIFVIDHIESTPTEN